MRQNLHVILCFSPVGDDFRNRAMKFPALVNCTSIDWFQPWPSDALLSVGKKYLAEVDLGDDAARLGVETFMPFSFTSVGAAAIKFRAQERREVHTTPKSFLELLKLYVSLLARKRSDSEKGIERLEQGVFKLKETGDSVDQIAEDLDVKLVAAEEKKIKAEGIAAVVSVEKAIVEEECAKAAIIEEKSNKIAADVAKQQKDTEEELAQALPAVAAAMKALDSLNKKDLGEAKTMAKTPAGVEEVFSAVACLLASLEPNLVLDKKGRVKDVTWNGVKKAVLGNIPGFLTSLLGFKDLVDTDQVPAINFKEVRKYLAMEIFDAEIIRTKNSAAAGLCGWVINIVRYRDIVVSVEPLRAALAAATIELNAANETLRVIQEKVHALTTKLAILTKQLNEAESDKAAAILEVTTGQRKLDLAQRLTRALADENVRWKANIITMTADKDLLVGDVLLASAFIR